MDESELLQLSNELRLACMRIARRARAESRGHLPQHRYSVLTRLEDGPLTVGALADREGVSAPAMTRNVNELERAGMVRRSPDPDDGRQTLVELTAEGDALRLRVMRNRDEWMASRLVGFAASELGVLRAAAPLLHRFVEP